MSRDGSWAGIAEGPVIAGTSGASREQAVGKLVRREVPDSARRGNQEIVQDSTQAHASRSEADV